MDDFLFLLPTFGAVMLGWVAYSGVTAASRIPPNSSTGAALVLRAIVSAMATVTIGLAVWAWRLANA